MKIKNILLVFVVLALVGVVGVWHTQAGNPSRYFIHSDSGLLRALTGVQWNFDHGYTTDLTDGQRTAIEQLTSRLGIMVEQVPLYHVTSHKANHNPQGKPESGTATRTVFPSDQTPWGIEKMYGDPLLVSTSGGLGVDVAVLDTGVKKDHFDIRNRVKQCKDFTSGVTIRFRCSDVFGHGTHVSGTIVADGGSDTKGIYGMAPEANLWAYKVCDNSGFCWADDIAWAIRHAADQGVEIVSMSLGGDLPSSLIASAVDYAVGKGVLVVAAAGNDGPQDGTIDYPGAFVNVVAVGAIDSLEQVPNWSSRGVNPGTVAYVIEEREVEFGAPGVAVESTWNDGGYRVISGTSMATPHVTGLAAKFWKGSGAATRTFIQSMARDIWTPGDDSATGFGLPDIP